jgi:hypothetical protein
MTDLVDDGTWGEGKLTAAVFAIENDLVVLENMARSPLGAVQLVGSLLNRSGVGGTCHEEAKKGHREDHGEGL